MKKFNIVLFTLLIIVASIFLHFGFNLLWVIIANYEDLSVYELAQTPMFAFMAIIVILTFYLYRSIVLKKNNPYTKKLYSLLVLIFSLIGIGLSIFVGAAVYHNFFARYIFVGFPFIMLITHLVFLSASAYYFIKNILFIKNNEVEKPEKSNAKHIFKTIGFAFAIMFCFVRFGALFFLPFYYSSYDGYLAIPLYIQFLVPIIMLGFHLYYRDFIKDENKKKFSLISSISLFSISLLTFVYMLVVTKFNYPGMINATSNIVGLERMTTIPINFISLYLVCLGLTLTNIVIIIVKRVRK